MVNWAELAGAMRSAGPALENHLWQSTVFAGVAAGLALALKQNQARARYWIWMSASVKLLLPFALLAGVVGHFARPKAVPALHSGVVAAVVGVSEPFQGQVQGSRDEAPWVAAEGNATGQSFQPQPAKLAGDPGSDGVANFVDATRDEETVTNGAPRFAARSAGSLRAWAPVVLGGVWVVVFVTFLVTWSVRWQRVARAMRSAEVVRAGREVGTLRRVEAAAGVRSEIEIRLVTPRQTDGPTWGTQMEPGVFGIVRPVLAWPERISGRLDDAHLEAVLAHEVCHVRRRDNLTAALHMVVQAVFWFHPLVWWVGARLVEERERACDEEVLALFGRPEAYAESILKVCEFCVSSPLECVAGVTGADLKKRVVEIMNGRVVHKLTWGKKLLLIGVGLCVAAVPIVMGQAKAARRMMEAAIAAAPGPLKGPARAVFGTAGAMIAEEETPATELLAEADPPKPSLDGAPNVVAGGEYVPTMTFDVASVRESKLDPNLPHRVGGGFSPPHSTNLHLQNVQLYYLLTMAYGVDIHQLVGLPDWGWTSYNIEAKSDSAADEKLAKLSNQDARAEEQHMLQTLLAERLKLKIHWETREDPIYDLAIAKGGSKLLPPGSMPVPPEEQKWLGDKEAPPLHQQGDGRRGYEFYGHSCPMENLAKMLGSMMGRDVVDTTGLSGKFDFHIQYRGETARDDRDQDPTAWPPLIDAVQDQLGLKLVPAKGPVRVLVVDHVEKPVSVDGAEAQSPSLMLVAQVTPPRADNSAPGVVVSAGPGAAAVGVRISAEEAAIAESIEFDVASFKVNTLNRPHATFEMPQDGDGFTILNRPMRDLIRFAYNVTSGVNYHFSNEPAWINEVKWDIRAKVAPEDIPKWQKLSNAGKTLALRRFCEEELKLKFHADTTPYTFYTLVVDKKGPKMAEAQPDDTYQAPNGMVIPAGGVVWMGPGMIVSHAGTMTQLAVVLSGHSPYVVHDDTGLNGVYNFSISYAQGTMDDPRARAVGYPPGYLAAQDDGPTLYNAISALGLKLVATKGTLEGMVVDHVELPSKD